MPPIVSSNKSRNGAYSTAEIKPIKLFEKDRLPEFILREKYKQVQFPKNTLGGRSSYLMPRTKQKDFEENDFLH